MNGDRIVLEGMRFFAHHGDVPAERELGAHLEVDVEVQADLRSAARTDTLDAALDYVRCYEVVRAVVEEQQFHLLETVAEHVADALLAQPGALAVRVRVAKQPPIAASLRRFAVVIERSNAEAAT